VYDLFSLAMQCLGNNFKEPGNIEDAPTLSEAKGIVGKEAPGSIVEKFALQILHERLWVQHIGESRRR